MRCTRNIVQQPCKTKYTKKHARRFVGCVASTWYSHYLFQFKRNMTLRSNSFAEQTGNKHWYSSCLHFCLLFTIVQRDIVIASKLINFMNIFASHWVTRTIYVDMARYVTAITGGNLTIYKCPPSGLPTQVHGYTLGPCICHLNNVFEDHEQEMRHKVEKQEYQMAVHRLRTYFSHNTCTALVPLFTANAQ